MTMLTTFLGLGTQSSSEAIDRPFLAGPGEELGAIAAEFGDLAPPPCRRDFLSWCGRAYSTYPIEPLICMTLFATISLPFGADAYGPL